MSVIDLGDLTETPVSTSADTGYTDFGDLTKTKAEPSKKRSFDDVVFPKSEAVDTRKISYTDEGTKAREWLQKKPEGPTSYSDYFLRVLPESAVRTGVNLALMPGQLTSQALTDPGEAAHGLWETFKTATGTVAGAATSPYNVVKGDFGQTEGKQGLGKWLAEGQEKIISDPFGAAIDPFMAKGLAKGAYGGVKATAKVAGGLSDVMLKPIAGEGLGLPERLTQSTLKMRITDTAKNAKQRAAAIKQWLTDPNASLSMNKFVDRNLTEMADIVGKQNLALDAKGDVRFKLDDFENSVRSLITDEPTSLLHGDALPEAVGKVIENIKKDKSYNAEDNSISARAAQDIKKQVWEDLRGKNAFSKDYNPAMVEAAWKGASALNRAIKEIIPEMGELNSRYGDLANLNKQMIRALQRNANSNIVPLRALIQLASGNFSGLLHGAAVWLIDEPFFKAAVARKLYKARNAPVLPAELNAVLDSMKAKFQQNLREDSEPLIRGPEAVRGVNEPVPPPPPGPESFEPRPTTATPPPDITGSVTPPPGPDMEYNARNPIPTPPPAEIVPPVMSQGEAPTPRGPFRPTGDIPQAETPVNFEPSLRDLAQGRPAPTAETMDPNIRREGLGGVNIYDDTRSLFEQDPSLRNVGGPQPRDRVAVEKLVNEVADKQGNIHASDAGYLSKKLREMGFTEAEIKSYLDTAMKLGGVAALTVLPFLDDENRNAGLGLMLGSIAGMKSAKAGEIPKGRITVDPFDLQQKFHVSDATSKINWDHATALRKELRTDPSPAAVRSTTLGELVSDAEIFDHYPKLKTVPVKLVKAGYPNALFTDSANGPMIILKGAAHLDMTKSKMRELLGHEWQHWIQEHEGFSSGGSYGNTPAEYEHYMRQGGEVEARGVAENMDMPTQDNPLFYLTEDNRVGPNYFRIENGGRVYRQSTRAEAEQFAKTLKGRSKITEIEVPPDRIQTAPLPDRRYMYDKVPAEKEMVIMVDKAPLPVIVNPTAAELQQMIRASRDYWKELGSDITGTERNLRFAKDKKGDYYFWDGGSATHAEAIKKLGLDIDAEGYVTRSGNELQFKDSKNVDIGDAISIPEWKPYKLNIPKKAAPKTVDELQPHKYNRDTVTQEQLNEVADFLLSKQEISKSWYDRLKNNELSEYTMNSYFNNYNELLAQAKVRSRGRLEIVPQIMEKVQDAVRTLSPEEVKTLKMYRVDKTGYGPKNERNKFESSTFATDTETHKPHGKFFADRPQDAAELGAVLPYGGARKLPGKTINKNIAEHYDNLTGTPGDPKSTFKDNFEWSAGRPVPEKAKIAIIDESDLKRLSQEWLSSKTAMTQALQDLGYTHLVIERPDFMNHAREIIQLEPRTSKIRGRKDLYSATGLIGAQLLKGEKDATR